MHRFKQERALSSAGSEHLPYKQRVGGSNPSAPTTQKSFLLSMISQSTRALSSAGSEHLPYKQRVGGSNPSAPTTQKSFLLSMISQSTRALSSAGSEHLPYKQRVGGSNPSAPTPSSTPIPFRVSALIFLLTNSNRFIYDYSGTAKRDF